MIRIGLTHERTVRVTEHNVAESYGSGYLPVYATPAMIALMEAAACDALQPYLEEGTTTVGTAVNIVHLAPSPIGMEITARAELIAIDRKKFTFKVEAFDRTGKIGEGTHERFVIRIADFLAKSEAKLRENPDGQDKTNNETSATS